MTVKGRVSSLPVLLEWFCFGASGLSLSSDSSLGRMQMRDPLCGLPVWMKLGRIMNLMMRVFKVFPEKEKQNYIQEPTSGCLQKNPPKIKTTKKQNRKTNNKTRPQNLTTKSALWFGPPVLLRAHHSFTPGCKKFLRIFVKLQLCTRNSYVLLQLTLDPVRLPGSNVKPHILLASVAFPDNSTKTKKNPQNNNNKKAAEFQGLWLLNLHKIFFPAL